MQNARRAVQWSKGKTVGDLSLSTKVNDLEPEIVLPAQFYRYNGSKAAGEKHLLFELLAGALHDLNSAVDQVRIDAEQWIFTGNTGSMSCQATCEYLDIDYGSLVHRIKNGLKQLKLMRGQRPKVVYERECDDFDRFPSHQIERASTRDRRFLQLALFEQRES